MNSYLQANRDLWDARTGIHIKSNFYNLSDFLKYPDRLSLMPTELSLIPKAWVKGKSLLHLQCHFGMDTLSWARLGAKCVGIDFSSEAIHTAQNLNQRLGLDVEFIQTNLYDLHSVLNQTFDVVFTSYGVLCWLHDLKMWGKIVADKLKPGGVFTMVEFHPFIYMYDLENVGTWGWRLKYPYFYENEPIYEKTDHTYTDSETIIALDEYTWNHSLSEVMNALLDAGLQIAHFQEYPYSHYNVLPDLIRTAEHEYHIKDHFGLPLMYSLTAQKEEAV